jgi:alpha-L-fucosidase
MINRKRRGQRVVTPLVAMLALLGAGTAGADAAPAEVIAISPTDTPARIAAKAANVVPSQRQLAWQRRELTALIHVGVNTYTDLEKGTGTEDPNIFQPTELDTDQWVRTLRDAGFKQVMLTAKHEDGFLLFPSKYSTFGVASDSWHGGTGDVVRSFTASAAKYGLKVGIYLSPADQHEALPGGRFANNSAPTARTIPSDPSDVVNGQTFQVTADDYNAYYMNTLYELLTRYGNVDEVWWDGHNGTGKSEYYDIPGWIRIARALQPNAVLWPGIDVRWVSNEDGVAKETEWSPLPYAGDPATAADQLMHPSDPYAADLGSDAVLGQRNADGRSKWNFLKWSPAECNTPQMTVSGGSWFWHPSSEAKSQAQLEDIYYTTVGRNCVLLLGFAPDRRGLFDQKTLDSLTAFSHQIHTTFAHNLATNASATNAPGTTNTTGHPPHHALDSNLDTSWQPTTTTGALTLDLHHPTTFDIIAIQEDLHIGQRTQTFAIDTWTNNQWQQIATDTTIGNKKLLRLTTPTTTNKIRLRITAARAAPAITEIGLYHRPTADNTASATG